MWSHEGGPLFDDTAFNHGQRVSLKAAYAALGHGNRISQKVAPEMFPERRDVVISKLDQFVFQRITWRPFLPLTGARFA